MADKDDHLTYYRQFFENFAKTLNPNDQLPVKLASYKLVNTEIVGGIIDWTTQYLSQKKCPPNLCAPLIKIVIDEIRKACKKHPVNCGFNPADNAYEPLKLMQTVMAKTNEVCLRYLDNSMLCSLPSPESGNQYYLTSVYAIKNTRRRMEDRHVVIHDLNTMFNIQEDTPSSYYAIFDGHAGHDAAAYSSAHLHQFLAENDSFLTNPKQALLDAFCQTDALFINKCEVEHLSSGTTAVVALIRPKEKMLYLAWAGDSQATLVGRNRVVQLVNPHKPCRNDERERIEQQGGCVLKWGTWRVNGQLAVSRAIGDPDYKPFVIAVPDIQEIPLEGNDFLVLACDGLWDSLSEEAVAHMVYSCISKNPDDTDSISKYLVVKAKQQGSSDNISVIVVFLREPSKIAAEAHWANRNVYTMEEGLNNANNPNPFGCANGSPATKTEGLLKQNGLPQELFEKSNGKRLASEFDEDDDFGPETDVDTVDDVIPVTTGTNCEVPKSFAECFEPASDYSGFEEEGVCNPFVEHQEKASAEMQKVKKKVEFQEDGERVEREETPTPPADAVHDASGLVDSDSEDEWNYFKGGEANKENVSPQPEKEVADIEEEDDTMSQLNPNAAEFVPVSPTRSVASPPSCIRALNEAIISESPKKAIDIDISLPNVRDFENEVKSRPGDINLSDGSISKSSTSDSSSSNLYRSFEDLPTICSSRDNPSKDLMENILNGKNIDEIPEFQPNSDSPKKVFQTDEFHFGPKALPFINKPNEQSEQDNADPNTLIDPAAVSPDLNKLHDIPDDLEKFLETDNDTLNDSFRESNKDNDAFKLSDVDDEKELASPLESEKDSFKSDEPKLLPNIDFLNVSSEEQHPTNLTQDLPNSVESESICCSNESNTIQSSRESYEVLPTSPAHQESDFTGPEAVELAQQTFVELCSAEPPPRDLQRETSLDATPIELIQEADMRFEELCKPLESPQEEATSSVKDDLSEGMGDNSDVRLIDTDDNSGKDEAPVQEQFITENEQTNVENLVEIPKEEFDVMVPSIQSEENESLLEPCDTKTEPILEPTVVTPEEPKIEEPIIEESKIEELKMEEPKIEEPTIDAPATSSKSTKIIIPSQTTIASILINNLEIPLAASSSAQAAFRREIIGTNITKSFSSLVPRTIILNSSDVNNLCTNSIPRLLTDRFKLFCPNPTRLTLSMGKENKILEIVASSSEIKIEEEFNLPESIEENDYQPFYDYSYLFPAYENLFDEDLYGESEDSSLSPEENRIKALKQLLQQFIRTEERPQSSVETSSTPANEIDNPQVNVSSDCKNCGDRLYSTILVSKGICINPEMQCHMENMQSVVSEIDLSDYQRNNEEYGFVRWPSTIEEKGIFVESSSNNEDEQASNNRAEEKIQSKSVHFVETNGLSNTELGFTLEDNDCSSNSYIFPNRSASGDQFESIASDKSEQMDVEYAKSLMNQLIDTISWKLQENKLKTSNTLMVYMLRSGIEKLKQTKSLPDSFNNKKKRKQPVCDSVETNEDNQETIKSSLSDSFRPVCDYSFLPSTSNNNGNIPLPASESNDVEGKEDKSQIGRESSVVLNGLEKLLTEDTTDKSICDDTSTRVDKVVDFDDNVVHFEHSFTHVSSAAGVVGEENDAIDDCDYSLVPCIVDSVIPATLMKVEGASDCDYSLMPTVDYNFNSASCPIVNLGKIKDDSSIFDVPDREYYPSAPSAEPLRNDVRKFKQFSSVDVPEFVINEPDCDYSLMPFIDDSKMSSDTSGAVENDVRANSFVDCDYSLIPFVGDAKISDNSSQVIENYHPFALFTKTEKIVPPVNKKFKYFGSQSFALPSFAVKQVDDSTSIPSPAVKAPFDVTENVSLTEMYQPICDNSFALPTEDKEEFSSPDEYQPACDYSFSIPFDLIRTSSSGEVFNPICDYSFSLPSDYPSTPVRDQRDCDYSLTPFIADASKSAEGDIVIKKEASSTEICELVCDPLDCDYSLTPLIDNSKISWLNAGIAKIKNGSYFDGICESVSDAPDCDYSSIPFVNDRKSTVNNISESVENGFGNIDLQDCDYSLTPFCESRTVDVVDCDYSLVPCLGNGEKRLDDDFDCDYSLIPCVENGEKRPVTVFDCDYSSNPVVDSKTTSSKVRKGVVQFREVSPAVEVQKALIFPVEFSEIVSLIFDMFDGVARALGDAENIPSLVGNFYSPICDSSFALPADDEDVTGKSIDDDYKPVCDYSFTYPTDYDEGSMKSTDDYKSVCDYSYSLPLSLPYTDFRNYSLDIDNPTFEKYQPVFDYSFSYPVDDGAVNDSGIICESFSFIVEDDPLSSKRDLSLCYTDFRNYNLDCNNPTFERYQPVFDYSFCQPVDDAVSDNSKPVRDSLISPTTDDNVLSSDRDYLPLGFTDFRNYSLNIDNPTFEKYQPVFDYSFSYDFKPICDSAFTFPVENDTNVSPAIDPKPSLSLPIEHKNVSPVIEECEFVNNQSTALQTFGIEHVTSSFDNVREVSYSIPNDIDSISPVIEEYTNPIKAGENVLSLTDMYQPVCDYSFALPGEEREDLSLDDYQPVCDYSFALPDKGKEVLSHDGYQPVCDYSFALPDKGKEELSHDGYQPVCDYSFALPDKSKEELSRSPDGYQPVCDYSFALPGEEREDLSLDDYQPVCDYSFALPGESKEDLSQSLDDYHPVCDYSFALAVEDFKKGDDVKKVASVEDSLKSVGDYVGLAMLLDDCRSISFVEIGNTVSVMIDKVDEVVDYKSVSSREKAGEDAKDWDSKVFSNGEEVQSSVITVEKVSDDKIVKDSLESIGNNSGGSREMATSLADNVIEGIENALGNIRKAATCLVDTFKTSLSAEDAPKIEKVIAISEKPSKMSLFEGIPDSPLSIEDYFQPVCDYSFALPVEEASTSDIYRPVCDYSFALSTSPIPDDRAVWAAGSYRPVCDYSFVLSTVEEAEDSPDPSIETYLPVCDYSFALPVKGGDETAKKMIKNYRRVCNIAHASSAKETKRLFDKGARGAGVTSNSDQPICDYFYVPSVCDHRLQKTDDQSSGQSSKRIVKEVDGVGKTGGSSKGAGETDDDTVEKGGKKVAPLDEIARKVVPVDKTVRKVDGVKKTGGSFKDAVEKGGKKVAPLNEIAGKKEESNISAEEPVKVLGKRDDSPVEGSDSAPDSSDLNECNSDRSYREYFQDQHLSDNEFKLNFSASDTDYYQSVFDDTYREIEKYQPVCDYSYNLPNKLRVVSEFPAGYQPIFDYSCSPNLEEQITVELSPSRTKSLSITEPKKPDVPGDLISTVKKEFDVRRKRMNVEDFRTDLSVDSIELLNSTDEKKGQSHWQERSLDSTEMKEGLLAVTEFQTIDSLVLPYTVEENRTPTAPISPDQFVVNFRKILANTLVSALSNFKNEFSQEIKKIDGDSTAFLDSQTSNASDAQKLMSELESEMTAIGITSTVAAGAAFTAVLTEKERLVDVPKEAEKEPLKEHQDNQQKELEQPKEVPKSKPVALKTTAVTKTSKTGVTAKTPLPKTTTTATNKLASKTSVASKTSGNVAASQKVASKSTLAAKPTARSAPAKTADKVVNGEAKPSARLTSARRPAETASKPKLAAQTATSKSNVTRAPSKKLEPTAVKTTKSVEMKRTTITKKPLDKPNTAVSAATKVSNTAKVPSSGVTKPKTSTLIAPPKPRVPLTKTVAKTDAPKPDAQKQNKENVNKLMASRTATKPASSNVKKAETKVSSVRSVTKTTTSTLVNKKKTITSPKPEKIEKPKENGVAAIVTEVN